VKASLRRSCSHLAVSVRTRRVSTCDGAFRPLLFGNHPPNFSKPAISIQPIVSPNFREAQALEATKVIHLAATSVNMISRGRDLFRSDDGDEELLLLQLSPRILSIVPA